MRKCLMFFVVVVFLFSFVSVNAKVVVINTNSYESVREDEVVEKNVTRTLVFYKLRRVKSYAYDEVWYGYITDKRFEERMEEKMDDGGSLKEERAMRVDVYSVPRSDYLKYYECYDTDFDRYYKDYDFWNPCQD